MVQPHVLWCVAPVPLPPQRETGLYPSMLSSLSREQSSWLPWLPLHHAGLYTEILGSGLSPQAVVTFGALHFPSDMATKVPSASRNLELPWHMQGPHCLPWQFQVKFQAIKIQTRAGDLAQ